MTAFIWRLNKYLYVILVLTVLFLLSACTDDGLLKESAQEIMGGNGAGLSEYQEVP